MTPVMKKKIVSWISVVTIALGASIGASACTVHTYATRPAYVYRTTYAPGYTYQYTPQYGYVYVRPAPVVRSAPPPRGRVVVRSEPRARVVVRSEPRRAPPTRVERGDGRHGGRGHGRHRR